MVPHLVTALAGPINELEQRILESLPAIERWFRLEWMEHTPPFYAAVDLRNAGFKLAPVDTELFPGAFNNLTDSMLPLAVQAAQAVIEKTCPEAKNLLIVPRGGTVDPFYLGGVQKLAQIFRQAGLEVRLGSLDRSLKAPLRLEQPDGSLVVVEPMLKSRGRLGLKDFDPCTILLNNNLATGTPEVLNGLEHQFLLPPLHAGFPVRRKSAHFASYEEVAKGFAKLLGMDPWLINPLHARCTQASLDDDAGLECLMHNADVVLAKVRRKYKDYGIGERPFVVIKADNATSGAGFLSVRDARDIPSLARARRAELDAAAALEPPRRGRAPAVEAASEFLIQEGVPTYERVNQAVAEPVVYTIDRYVIGGFYRVHAGRGADQNLSGPGSLYVPLAFEQSHSLPRPGEKPGASPPNRFYMYGVIGRLATLAAAYELEATDPHLEMVD